MEAPDAAPSAPAPRRVPRRPPVTLAMLGLFGAVYAVEVAVSRDPASFTPDVDTLVSMGGISRTLFDQGEWHRLLTAALLHGSPLHLLFNGIAFWFGGGILEAIVGPAWLIVVFCLGAVGGSLMSVALNPPNVVSVGASGAIMALLAAAFLVTFRIPRSAGRGQLRSGLLQMLIPSLLPLVPVHGESIDYADHFGGTLAGLAAGAFLLLAWQAGAPRPRLEGLARTLAAVGLALAVWGGIRVGQLYPSYATSALLIPQDQIPADDDAAAAQAPAFLAKYPKDPRSHLFQALALLDRDQAPAAETELRAALANPVILKTHFSVGLEVVIRALLAQALLRQDEPGQAKAAVQPVCHAGPSGSVPKELASLELCGS
ncbi:MAG: rhomboid family intramembrane serine protease [Myxococcales bacterium]